jgi:hypothetical protein
MDAALEYLIARFQEPSTWVSLGTMLTGIGVSIAPQHWQIIMAVGMIGGGALGAAIRERKKTTPAEIKAVVQQTVEKGSLK